MVELYQYYTGSSNIYIYVPDITSRNINIGSGTRGVAWIAMV